MIRRLCMALVHLFFSEVRILDSGRLPSSGPVLIVANHHSSLIDPAVLIATLNRQPRFLAKAVLWKPIYLPLRPFLNAAGAVPVHRVKDGGGNNDDMFSATRRILSDGELVALFGEGISHDMPGLADLRTGAARIALGTEAVTNVVPVGLVYPDRSTYRSTVTVAVGTPIPVRGSAGGDADRAEVKRLTSEIAAGLRQVAPTWETTEDQIAAVFATEITVAEGNANRGATLNALNRAVDNGTEEGQTALNAAKDLLDECEHLGVSIEAITDPEGPSLKRAARASRAGTAVWALPTLVGKIANFPPFKLTGKLSDRRDENFQATSKILLGVFIYPAWWVVVAVAAALTFNLTIGLLTLLALPITGYISALKMHRLRRLNRTRLAPRSRSQGKSAPADKVSTGQLTALEVKYRAVVEAVKAVEAAGSGCNQGSP